MFIPPTEWLFGRNAAARTRRDVIFFIEPNLHQLRSASTTGVSRRRLLSSLTPPHGEELAGLLICTLARWLEQGRTEPLILTLALDTGTQEHEVTASLETNSTQICLVGYIDDSQLDLD
jgi:hypothetical protein